MPDRQGTSRSRGPGLAWLALAALAGAVLVQTLPLLPPGWLDSVLAGIGLWLAWRHPRLRMLALLLLMFAWTAWCADLALQSRLPRNLEKQDFDVVGTVRDLPETGPIASRFTLHVEKAWLHGKPLHWSGNTRVTWYGLAGRKVRPCTRWYLRLRLKRPRGLADPGARDSERTALERREVATGYVRKQGDNHRIGRQGWCVDRLRSAISKAIAGHLGKDAHATRLIQSLTVGDTRGLDVRDWDVARANGISHLLAISGFHVGVAALFGAWAVLGLWWLFPGLGRALPRPVAQALAAMVTAGVYGALAGFGLPTERTLIMIATVAMARIGRRSTGGMQSLAMALLVILLWDPLAVLAPGFWLSFAGVAFLMLGLAPPHGLREHVSALVRTEWLMTVTLLPLSVWMFGQASLIGMLSNLVAVPVVSLLVVPLALTGTLLWPIAPPAAGGLWQLAGGIMQSLWWLLEQMAHWPLANWYPPMATSWAMLLATLGAIWWFLPRGLPMRWLGLVLFLPLLWPASSLPQTGGFRLWVLDVGQGLSVLVRTRYHVLLYDAGARYPSGYDLGRAAVLPAMRALGVHRLDVLMISHGDNDHAGGAGAVVKAFPAARRLSGEPGRVGLGMRACHAGQQWRWDGVEFRVLSPVAGRRAERDNDRSCVLLIRGQGGRALLTGDISRQIEPQVAAAVGNGPPLVLLVPHHGSKSSSSPAFLAALHPCLAIASAGWLNRFHHPAAVVVKRYARHAIRFLNTATSGAVEVEVAPSAPPRLCARWRVRERPYWREP